MGEQEIGLVDEGLIRISDVDSPIYRIFPLWVLEETLRLRQLALVAPSKWEDPFEVIGDNIAVDIRRGDRIEQKFICRALSPAFAQCWSRTTESDTLIRAYSRVVKDPIFGRNICSRDEGVRVRSSARKLLEAVRSGNPSGLSGKWFVGAVQYLSSKALLQEIANAVSKDGLNCFEVPSKRANLLLLKREAFSHEAEVRVIYVQQNQEPCDAIVRVPIEPSALFDQISFDPRLAPFEWYERETMIRSLGYKGEIIKSDLYQRTVLEVLLDDTEKSAYRQ
jgi:hypothetical protein